MATLTELARFHTALDGRAVNHLQRLVAGWGLLADFCFADLLLFAPTIDAQDGDRFLVLGQIRPSTSQTVYRADWIGTTVDTHEQRLAEEAQRRDMATVVARSYELLTNSPYAPLVKSLAPLLRIRSLHVPPCTKPENCPGKSSARNWWSPLGVAVEGGLGAKGGKRDIPGS